MRGIPLAFVAILLMGSALAQDGIDTTLDRGDLEALERLVATAQALDLDIAAIRAGRQADALALDILRDALTLTVSGSVAGDIYGQARADYRISVGIDLLELLPDPAGEIRAATRLESELRRVRLAVTEAFVRYRVAEERADVAALALESAQADYQVARARHRVGDVVLADVLAARHRLGSAAVALLEANGEVVIALENLAATVGTDVHAAREMLGSP